MLTEYCIFLFHVGVVFVHHLSYGHFIGKNLHHGASYFILVVISRLLFLLAAAFVGTVAFVVICLVALFTPSPVRWHRAHVLDVSVRHTLQLSNPVSSNGSNGVRLFVLGREWING
jgi:hypothetical protein